MVELILKDAQEIIIFLTLVVSSMICHLQEFKRVGVVLTCSVTFRSLGRTRESNKSSAFTVEISVAMEEKQSSPDSSFAPGTI